MPAKTKTAVEKPFKLTFAPKVKVKLGRHTVELLRSPGKKTLTRAQIRHLVLGDAGS